MSADAPLAWRLRHQLGTLAFYASIVFAAAGAWTIVYAIVVGPLSGLALGLPLLIGGLLVMVGRRKRK